MKKVEQYIKEHARNCSNEIIGWDKNMFPIYQDWLTPDQARKAVEIAREETINEVFNYIKDKYEDIGLQYIRGYEADVLIEDLKKHLEELTYGTGQPDAGENP